MEEHNNQNLEQQGIEQKETEQLPKEEKKEVNVQAPTKKPFPKIAIVAVALAVVALVIILVIALGGNKGGNITCESCGANISDDVKFCSSCGNAVTPPSNNNNNNNNNNNDNSNKPCQHSFGAWQEKVSADCTNAGTSERTCTKCSYKETKSIAALGHTTTTSVCNRCNQRIGWTKEELQNIVQVHDVYVDDINSVGGVDMRISWTNTSDKTIKYIHFYVVPYNAVGDKMYCDIRDHSRFDAYVTGPCEPGHKGYYKIGDIYYGNLWETVWYNNSIRTIELVGIKIIYMDGSVIDIEEKDVSKTFVDFSPLKEGYDIDEAFTMYYPDDSWHRFYWAIDYLGVSVRPNVNIDVRIVNDKNVEVFSGEYYARTENYTEINQYGVNKWMIATSMYDSQITPGSVSTGTLYYHIWSDDGTIDLGERSVKIDNLPIGSNDFTFELNEDGQSYSVYGNGQYDSLSISIPEQFNGKPVTTIGSFAFSSYGLVTSIVIPDSITYIDSFAFADCTSLSSITIGKNVTEIKTSAFSGCNSLQQINTNSSNSKYKTIDGNLYSKDGKTLLRYAPGKTNQSFTIPSGVETVWGGAFSNCSYLKEISVGDNVSSISGLSFDNCVALTSINVSLSNPKYKSINGDLYTKDGKTLLKYANGKSQTIFSIPDGVEEIGEWAFECCNNLLQVKFSNSVTKIGYYAFFACEALESVTINNGVSYIDEGAFDSCESLSSIHFNGTKSEWESIDKFYDEEWGFSWDYWTGDYIIYCSNGNIPKSN